MYTSYVNRFLNVQQHTHYSLGISDLYSLQQ